MLMHYLLLNEFRQSCSYRSYLLKTYSCKGRLNGPIWYERF
uniref:Uncharacterized protein n=1 Tax=Arundo donax TaxID=35708 RepID=A0A0A9DHS8_ARUDO